MAHSRFVKRAAAAWDLSALKSSAAEFPLWGTVALAALAAVGITFSQAREVWSTGHFFDTDDAMRAVQVRDLLAGQSWFDMTTWRFDPPMGVFSHWSRVVDVPLAGLELFFRLFLDAVRRARDAAGLSVGAAGDIAWPPGLVREKLPAPSASKHVAVLLGLLSGAIFLQFVPGRIDHHAPQIVLLLTSLGFFLRGLDAKEARAMAPASLGIGAVHRH